MSAINIIISSTLFCLFVGLSKSAIINFDPNAAAYFEKDIIVKSRRLSCKDYEVVNLNGTLLSKIPKGFVKSTTIKSIVLSYNKINEIRYDAFDKVPNLECLDLSYNKITISKLFNFRHDNLKTLIVDHQEVVEWDDFFWNDIPFFYTPSANFPNVETLSLKGISYEHSSLYSNLFPKLSTVHWEDNQMAYVISNLTDYFTPYLKVIHLERNRLKNFTVNDLRNVEELYLDENPLEIISIAKSSNLKIFSLAGCNLEKWHLWLPTVITLDVSTNRLEQMYNVANIAPNLENLSLNNNQFTIVPSLEHFHRLRKLSLNYNLIETISFTTMTKSLNTLYLRHNNIKDIHPSTFVNVPNLEILDLAENKLYSLTDDWGEPLKRLRHINLSSNKFKSIFHIFNFDISGHSFPNLERIFVKNNDFNAITKYETQYIHDNCTIYVS